MAEIIRFPLEPRFEPCDTFPPWIAKGRYAASCETCQRPRTECRRAGFAFLACTYHTANTSRNED